MQKTLILAIESSCDDSAIALLCKDTLRCVFHKKISQELNHAKFGGVVPELAARLHTSALPAILAQAKPYFKDICAVAVTSEPGLSVSLLGGVTMAKVLCAALNVPLIAVNHLIGHIYSLFLAENTRFEMGVLLVSGGHTMILSVDKRGELEILANTSDDSFGESFDKVAKMLNLGYPGGVEIENLARKWAEFEENFGGNSDKNSRKNSAFLDEKTLNFSLETLNLGEKNSVLEMINSGEKNSILETPNLNKKNIVSKKLNLNDENPDLKMSNLHEKNSVLETLNSKEKNSISKTLNLDEKNLALKTLKFPVPLRNSPNLEFSFSGLKNAVRVKISEFAKLNSRENSAQIQTKNSQKTHENSAQIQALNSRKTSENFAKIQALNSHKTSENSTQISPQIQAKTQNLSDLQKAAIAFAFEEAAIAHILDKTKKAFKVRRFRHFGVVGGASANLKLRSKIKNLCDEFSCELHLAPLEFCADNALMIARAAVEKFKRGEFSEISRDIISPKNRHFERV